METSEIARFKDMIVELENLKMKILDAQESIREIQRESMRPGGRNECDTRTLMAMDRKLTPFLDRIDLMKVLLVDGIEFEIQKFNDLLHVRVVNN
jgi:hypothetical protein